MKPLRLLFSVCLLILAITVTAQVKSSSGDKKMNDFIDGLMSKMTLQEKLGQMNLPASGDITTGEAESSDILIKIKEGKVGGLFNIKSVEKIKEVQRIASGREPTENPADFWDGCYSWLRNCFPNSIGIKCYMGYAPYRKKCPHCSY